MDRVLTLCANLGSAFEDVSSVVGRVAANNVTVLRPLTCFCVL